MTPSGHAISLIKTYEGFRTTAYKPVKTERYWTIGYGHCGPDVDPNQPITEARAEQLLQVDLRRVASGVTAICDSHEISCGQNQFDALCSLAYNIGVNALNDSTLIKLMADGDIQGAAAQFDRWIYAGGRKLPGLVKRRAAEKALFLA